jgi:hypothetical protein
MLFGLIGLTIAIGCFLVDEVTAHLDGTYTETRGKEPSTLSELVLKQSLVMFVGAIDGEQQDLAFEPYHYLDPTFIHEREQMSAEGASAAKSTGGASAQARDGADHASEEESSSSNTMKTMNTMKTLDVMPDGKSKGK